MSLSEADRAKIIAQQESFIDSQFGGLDLSGFPHLQEAKTAACDPFEPRKDGPAQSIREFVSNVDRATLEQLAEDTHNGNLVEALREQQGDAAVADFKLRCGDYVRCDENRDNLVLALARTFLGRDDGDTEELISLLIDGGHFTPANLEQGWRQLKAQGLAELPAGTAKELTQAEKLHVARLAQSGNTESALEAHLRYALGNDIGSEILSDPSYRPACDRAVWDCWQLATPDFAHNSERQQFISRFVGQRPLTLHLLNAAWSACRQHEAKLERSHTLGLIEPQNAVPAPQLDDLADEAVDSLYHGSLRQYARTVRRPAGVIA